MNSVVDFESPRYLFNGHLETLYPALLRKVDFQTPEEIIIETPDDDFLEIDYYSQQSKELVIICHGLEGNARRPYVLGMARTMFNEGYDVVAWNYRSCGSKPNRQKIFYHSGATYDLELVVDHFLLNKQYNRIHLIGFSLGANLILRYLGEKGERKHIGRSVAISAPIDLAGSCRMLLLPENYLYTIRFLKTLKEKILIKSKNHDYNLEILPKIKNLKEYDDYFTAPIHGFDSAEDYYDKCSSKPLLGEVKNEVLILNSRNDSFLSESCFASEHEVSPMVKRLHTPRGGHVGFKDRNDSQTYFSERISKTFITGGNF